MAIIGIVLILINGHEIMYNKNWGGIDVGGVILGIILLLPMLRFLKGKDL